MTLTQKVKICAECVSVIANGPQTPDQELTAGRIEARHPHAALVLAEGEAEFSFRQCQGCGELLAGDRYPACLIYEKTPVNELEGEH